MGKVVLSILLVACYVSVSLAQVEQGDSEIQMQGAITGFEGMKVVILNVTYGYFVTPKTEIGGGPMIIHTDNDFSELTFTSLTVFGRYNFVTGSKLVPYVAGHLYQCDLFPERPLDFPDHVFLQIGGGVKYFLSKYIAYDVSSSFGVGLQTGSMNLLIFGGISAFF